MIGQVRRGCLGVAVAAALLWPSTGREVSAQFGFPGPGQFGPPPDPVRLTILQTEAVHRLLDAYERRADGEFEKLVSRHAKGAAHWLAFETDAALWIDAAPAEASRRTLVAAAVALELADIQRDKWDGSRLLIEAGCMLLQRLPPSDGEREWHRAADQLAISMGDFQLLIDNPDQTPQQHLQAAQRRAAALPQMRKARDESLPGPPFQWLGHAQHAAARFPSASEFHLDAAIAHEHQRIGMNETLLVVRDIPVWMEPEAVDRVIAGGQREAMRVPPNRRMDRASATRLMALSPMGAARTSLLLWDVADSFGELIADKDVGAEARLRLGQTYVRLARPAAGLNEFAKADQTGSARVQYLARLFTGAVYVRTSRLDQGRTALASALEALPRAQAATFLLAPLLVEAGEGEQAAELLEAAMKTPVVQDPMQNYWSDPGLRDAAFARMREALK